MQLSFASRSLPPYTALTISMSPCSGGENQRTVSHDETGFLTTLLINVSCAPLVDVSSTYWPYHFFLSKSPFHHIENLIKKKINSLSIHVFSEQGSIPREKLHLVNYVYIMCTCDKCRYIFSVAPSSQNLRIRHYQCSTEMLTVESRYFWCCGTKIWRVICTVLTNVSTDEKKS